MLGPGRAVQGFQLWSGYDIREFPKAGELIVREGDSQLIVKFRHKGKSFVTWAGTRSQHVEVSTRDHDVSLSRSPLMHLLRTRIVPMPCHRRVIGLPRP